MKPMYTVRETSFGDFSRLYACKLWGLFGADLDAKGFDYPWLLSARLEMGLNPDVRSEGDEPGPNRIRKDGICGFRYQRAGALLFWLVKAT